MENPPLPTAPFPELTSSQENDDATTPLSPGVEAIHHHVADGVRKKLDPAWITCQRIGGLFVALILIGSLGIAAVALGFAFDVLPLSMGIWSLVSLLLLLRAWIWPSLAWKHAAYAVSELGLRIRRGVVVRSIASVPKSRVQHTDVSQGPVQRHFGIATLTVHTAGTQYAAVPVPGLPRETALAIRNFLIDDDEDDDGV
ncbi:MAG: PH domain-containing protein [Thermoanaerobaculia bacterium]|nr:PH domain-containing protein [Thermoanaerobaculia bacterium]